MHHHLWLHILAVLFAWPAGIVLGNLIANIFWLPVQWLGLHAKLATHHAALHAKLDLLMGRLDECPGCGHRWSEADLQPRDDTP